MSRAANASATRCAMRGPVVDRSTTRRTRSPPAIPSSAVATAKTTSGEGRLTITVSTRSATSRADLAGAAPNATRRSMAAARVSYTISRWPASMRRWAIGKPILPSPMNPMFMPMARLRMSGLGYPAIATTSTRTQIPPRVFHFIGRRNPRGGTNRHDSETSFRQRIAVVVLVVRQPPTMDASPKPRSESLVRVYASRSGGGAG